MGCYLFAVWKPYNDLCAVVPDNLSVTDALAISRPASKNMITLYRNDCAVMYPGQKYKKGLEWKLQEGKRVLLKANSAR